MEKNILIAGRQGQGIQTVGFIVSKAFFSQGYYVFAWQDFQSRIKGGESSFRIRISDKPVYALREKYDIVASIDAPCTIKYKNLVAPGGLLIAEDKQEQNGHYPDLSGIASRTTGKKIHSNSVLMGIITGLAGMNSAVVEKLITGEFSSKGTETVNENIAAFKAGLNWLSGSPAGEALPVIDSSGKKRYYIAGNDAVALGAVAGGCSFISAYPMTPSTGIITYLSRTSGKTGIIAEQAEDEIAAVNMAVGASYGGARAMTATSGGGFCLMTEGLSLSAMLELPLVIVLGQRPGPATGLPTRTEQGELNFALNAGHGEFPRFVFAPKDAVSAVRMMGRAFELSQKYSVPAIVLTDQYIADSYWTMEEPQVNPELKSYVNENPAQDYRSYDLSREIHERIIPGKSDALFVADSDEHDENGHITEDTGIRQRMADKRLAKALMMEKEMAMPEISGNLKSEKVLIAFGSNAGLVREFTGDSGLASVCFEELWPLKIPDILLDKYRQIYVAENNAAGQFASLLESKGVKVTERIRKNDGMPFTLDYLAEKIK